MIRALAVFETDRYTVKIRTVDAIDPSQWAYSELEAPCLIKFVDY